jgi:DNA-directed RNA polymerase subunit omega
MARITVEDCLSKFLTASSSCCAPLTAPVNSQGHTPKVDSKNKPGVTALREIAAGMIGTEMLKKVPG